jgi:hypothetical protein
MLEAPETRGGARALPISCCDPARPPLSSANPARPARRKHPHHRTDPRPRRRNLGAGARTHTDHVNQACALTLAEIELMGKTAPPREGGFAWRWAFPAWVRPSRLRGCAILARTARQSRHPTPTALRWANTDRRLDDKRPLTLSARSGRLGPQRMRAISNSPSPAQDQRRSSAPRTPYLSVFRQCPRSACPNRDR